MTYRQDAEKVLAVWREIERALTEAAPASAETEELQAEVLRLRDRYRALVEQAGQAHADDDPPTMVNGLTDALDVSIDNLRRVQFDIERERPATLVVVPQQPTDEPQVL